MILHRGLAGIFAVALAILKIQEPVILAGNFEGIVDALSAKVRRAAARLQRGAGPRGGRGGRRVLRLRAGRAGDAGVAGGADGARVAVPAAGLPPAEPAEGLREAPGREDGPRVS